jgi:hypothetical protein
MADALSTLGKSIRANREGRRVIEVRSDDPAIGALRATLVPAFANREGAAGPPDHATRVVAITSRIAGGGSQAVGKAIAGWLSKEGGTGILSMPASRQPEPSRLAVIDRMAYAMTNCFCSRCGTPMRACLTCTWTAYGASAAASRSLQSGGPGGATGRRTL